MLLQIPDLLTPDEVAQVRQIIDKAEWVDGKVTAGFQSARTKDNMQIPENHPASQEAGNLILSVLSRSPLFMASALPLKVYPPMFNSYSGGQSFGTHVDNAIRQVAGTSHRIRTDLSCTVFLTDPSEYEGGELCVEDNYGVHRVKLPIGHMVLYPATSLHFVEPVTKGARVSSFFWIQSMIRKDSQRTILFDLDTSIQQLTQDAPDHPTTVQLTGIYHNLLREWAET